MKLTLLGTGTSTGVPELGCHCEVCTSTDPRDSRLRTSALVEEGSTTLLIDCGPDFRQQMLRMSTTHIDGVLITHEHYDHVGGLDDLRPFSRNGDIPLYADSTTAGHIVQRMPYCFIQNPYPGIPRLSMNTVAAGDTFHIKNLEIKPLQVMHGRLPILGFRIGPLGYITDMKSCPPETIEALRGVDVLVVNALRYFKEHNTHQTVQAALGFIAAVQPREAFFVHMMHHIGLHAKIEKCLPPHVHFGYDGEVIEISESCAPTI